MGYEIQPDQIRRDSKDSEGALTLQKFQWHGDRKVKMALAVVRRPRNISRILADS